VLLGQGNYWGRIMEAAAVSARDDATPEDALAGVLSATSAMNEVRLDTGWRVPLLFFGGVLASYAAIAYAVYLIVAAIA
jgi:hypothetical protein